MKSLFFPRHAIAQLGERASDGMLVNREVERVRRRRERPPDDAFPALLRLQFERMPMACVITDPGSRIIGWNPAAETTFGYSREEALGRNRSLLLLPSSRRPHVEEIGQVPEVEEMAAPMVNENVTRDGRVILCEWRNTPLRDPAGSVIAILAVAQDITERAGAERALRESEERYRALISQVTDYAIFSTDEGGVITTWNEGCRHVLGYTESAFVGMAFAELFTPTDRTGDVPARALREASEVGTVRHDRWMMRRGGGRFYANGATADLRDAEGGLIGFSTVIRDHTRMKLAQDYLADRGESLERLVTERTEELERAMERLRLSERMASLGTLSAGLGHDLGNLLLPLEIRLSKLEGAGLAPDLAEHVDGVRACARYLKRLAKGLRLLATDPGMERAAVPTEIREWWRDVWMIMKDVLPRGIRFEDAIPDGECSVAIGRAALTQAVFNLVQNAADSLREREAGFVRVSAHEGLYEGMVTLRVTDDGPGMSAEVLRRCLEPYFSTKARGISTGMGLSFVHGLVSAAGGRVEIESAAGEGTTVGLVIPRAPARERADGGTRPLALVDLDDRGTRSFIVGVLCTLGFEVIEGAEASARPSICVVEPDGLARVGHIAEARVVVVGEPAESQALRGTGYTMLGANPDSARICQALRRAADEIGLLGAR